MTPSCAVPKANPAFFALSRLKEIVQNIQKIMNVVFKSYLNTTTQEKNILILIDANYSLCNSNFWLSKPKMNLLRY